MTQENDLFDVAALAADRERRPILCLDFDGVLHSYRSGWRGEANIPDPPVPGFANFIEQAVREFQLAVHSSRSRSSEGREAMRLWLERHLMAHYRQFLPSASEAARRAGAVVELIDFPSAKPAAFISLDDRAVTFTGTWPAIAELRAFRPWWGRDS
jgi:hypothetical protein